MSFRPLVSGFLFLLLLLSLLYSLSWLGEIKGASTGYAALLFPQRSLLPFLREAPETQPTVAQAVLDKSKMIDNLLQRIELEQKDSSPATVDSLHSVDDSVVLPPLPSPLDVTPLEGSEAGLQQLFPVFENLFQLQRNHKGSVRILHYGDSQIEGDRVTSYLRSRLQHAFGGAGTGLLNPCSPLYPPYGLQVKSSANLTLHSMVPATQREPHAPYGVLGAYCRVEGDETPGVGAQGEDSQISFQISRMPRVGRAMQFTHCGVLLRNEGAPTEALLYGNNQDSIIGSATFNDPDGIAMLRLPIPKDVHDFSVVLRSLNPPLLFALSFEGSGGVQVDNIPLRGSSGTDFIYINDTILRESARVLSPALILLQFGVNVVPTKVDSYDYYRGYLRRQILRLKRFFPRAGIILIGVSDMAEKVGLNYRTYSNMALVRAAQRQAAWDTDIAYWDSFVAMGGENSIVAWANAQPALANRDYVHFTPKGARFFSELFYAAFLAQYNGYVELHSKAQ